MPLKKREEGKGRKKGGGMGGKAALLVGGAGLLLFILGVKRRYRLDDGREIVVPDDEVAGEGDGEAK